MKKNLLMSTKIVSEQPKQFFEIRYHNTLSQNIFEK